MRTRFRGPCAFASLFLTRLPPPLPFLFFHHHTSFPARDHPLSGILCWLFFPLPIRNTTELFRLLVNQHTHVAFLTVLRVPFSARNVLQEPPLPRLVYHDSRPRACIRTSLPGGTGILSWISAVLRMAQLSEGNGVSELNPKKSSGSYKFALFHLSLKPPCKTAGHH